MKVNRIVYFIATEYALCGSDRYESDSLYYKFNQRYRTAFLTSNVDNKQN